MTQALRRLIAATASVTVAVVVIGAAVELLRFGVDDRATASRLESEVRRRVAYSTRRVESLARSVAAEGDLVRTARETPGSLTPLFERLADLRSPAGLAGTSATVYVPQAGFFPPAGPHRIMAWSDGPAGPLSEDRLDGPQALFVAPGTVGLRLVAVHPIVHEQERLGTAAAELVLSPILQPGACTGTLETSYGPALAAAPTCGAAAAGPDVDDGFLITGESGVPLLEVRFSADQFGSRRAEFRRQVLVVAALPLIVLVLLASAPVVSRRNRATATADWIRWTAATVLVVVGTSAAVIGLGALSGAREHLAPAVYGLAGLALAALVAGGWWWRPLRRRPWNASATGFVFEHLAGGGLVAGTLWLLSRLLQGRINAGSLDIWQFPLFPFDLVAVLYLIGVVLTQIALCWIAAVALGVLAERWRFSPARAGRAILATGLWLLPTGAILLAAPGPRPLSAGPWLAVAVALAAFGLLAHRLRRFYRHTTQTTRLLLLFAALAAPPLVTYPMSATAADQAARALIAESFAPAILDQPQTLQAALALAQREIDAMPQLLALVAQPPPAAGTVDSQSAYTVWNQTSLSRTRLTSEIELFSAEGRLASRFALNVPEYPYGEDGPVWLGNSCTWDVYGEAARIGAEERIMLHAERAVCDAQGAILGGLVLHVVSDYRSLPFVAAGSPYGQVLQTTDDPRAETRLAGLELVVYGWNEDPQFVSGRVAWAIPPDISDRLYASREPFWTAQFVGEREYAVYFANDRRGFYALGYPTPTFIEHATRVAEITALVAVLLVVLLAGATAYAPFVREHSAPLPVIFNEVRTSFYRKLFLFFVLAAVGPVILIALAFGAYTAGRIRADVEFEAAGVVTITHRLFEEFTALERASDDRVLSATDEQWMVIIRQMTSQDVNLYDGPRLVATSQRDLFDSGLLPTRTPASVYREIALRRLPTYVGVDRIGAFEYLVAAAPVPSRGRDVVITVPLATRQREIEQEINELNRRALVGAVVVVLFAAGLGAAVAGRVSDPVARLSRAVRQIAAGRLDVRIVADTADELKRLVDDFNTMTETLTAQRAELERSNRIKAWAQMARQVAHEIKNPLTPIQLAAEHLQRVHQDQRQPLGDVFDQCVATILRQVKLLRQIASEFSNFAAEPVPRPERVEMAALLDSIVDPYRLGVVERRIEVTTDYGLDLPAVRVDRTLFSRALTNLVENAVQAMPDGGRLRVAARRTEGRIRIDVADTGVGMDADAASRAFEPYFSTKTGGSGLGLPNAKRYVELSGGELTLETRPGAGTTVTVTLPVAPHGGSEAA